MGVVVIIVSLSLKFQWQFYIFSNPNGHQRGKEKKSSSSKNIQFNVEIEQIVNDPNHSSQPKAVKEVAVFYRLAIEMMNIKLDINRILCSFIFDRVV